MIHSRLCFFGSLVRCQSSCVLWWIRNDAWLAPEWQKSPRGGFFSAGVLWRYPAQRNRKIQMLVELPPVPSLSIELCVVVDTEQRMAGSGMAEVSSRWLFLCGPSVLLDQCLQFLRLQFGALGMQFGLTA